jgi:hypothetical protein
MNVRRPTGIVPRLTGGLRVPGLSKVGVLVMVIGLHADLVEHAFVFRATASSGGFSPGEHVTHFVVLVGMVLVLAGVIADGMRAARGREDRPEGSARDAVR